MHDWPMLRETALAETSLMVQAKKSPRGSSKYPGICKAALDLGVSRVHLWKVLTGRRESASLMRRWEEWNSANNPSK